MDASKIVPLLLFTLEAYHVVGHIAVLLRLRLLPRKDLVRIRIYFLVDTATVYCVSFFYTKQLQWLAAIQLAQHLYFFATWNESKYTRKVISWSSLDWVKDTNTRNRWEPEMVLGTLFDTVVHMLNVYLLAFYLNQSHIITALLLVAVISLIILLNPRLAWTSPWSMKQWVQKRVAKILHTDLDASMLTLRGS